MLDVNFYLEAADAGAGGAVCRIVTKDSGRLARMKRRRHIAPSLAMHANVGDRQVVRHVGIVAVQHAKREADEAFGLP